MKKIIYLLTLLLFGSDLLQGQNIGITTQNPVCFNSPGTNSYVAYMTNSVSAAGFSWTTSSSGSCAPQFFPNGNGTSATVVYPCCGSYSLILTAYNSSNTPIASGGTLVTLQCNSLSAVASNTAICSGSFVQLTASGANNYTWTGPGGVISNSANISVSPTVSTCYTVTGNSNGCNFQKSVCIIVYPKPVVSIAGNSVACQGDTLKLFASGASSYTWSTGSAGSGLTTQIFFTTCYTVVGTNSVGCSSSAVKCVTVGSSPQISGPNSVCAGNSIILTGSGASTYTWLPMNSNTASVVVTPTAYTCYTLLTNGICGSSSAVKCVSVNATPTIGISVVTNCSGTSTITATGAQNYAWNNGGSGGQIIVTPSVTTCYSVQGTVSNGCSSMTGTCLVPGNGVVITGPTAVCNGNSIILTASGSTSYTWYPGGVSGSTIAVSPTVSTCYTVVGTFTNGCQPSDLHCVNIGSSPTITTFGGSFCAGNTGSMTASGASTYTWLPYNQTGTSIMLTPSVSACYTVMGTNSSGCVGQTIGCFTVSPSPTITVSGASVICSGGSATLIASGGNTYNWFPGNMTGSMVVVSPSTGTCYTVYGNAGNCTGQTSKCVNVQSANVSISGPTVMCAGNSATLTANGGTSFTWQPVVSNFQGIVVSPTISTCYSVSATFTNGCTGFGVRCITVNQKPTITTSGGTFCGGNSGVLTASGANSYTWTPFFATGSTVVVTPSVSGCYTVTGTNNAGCTGFAVGCYTVQPSPTISVSGNVVLCPGESTTLTASGATSYTWIPLPNQFSAGVVVTPSVSTCYTVIGNNGGCSSSAVRCVTVQNINVSVSGPTFVCAGQSATLTASGASGYTWQPGNLTGNGIVVTPNVLTCYTVFASNSNGTCTAQTNKCISVQNNPTVTTNAPTFCYGITGVITATGASTYTWQPFNTNGSSVSLTPTTSACYTVTGANGFGCKSSATGCYSVVPNPTITVSGNLFLCSGSSTTLTATGANTYTWQQNGFPTTSSIVVTPTANTCYTVGGHSSNGCSTGVAVCVSVQTPTLQVTGPNVVCLNNNITLTANGSVNYTWQPGALTGSAIVVSPTANTCYTVTGTNPNGSCTSTAVKCVSVAPAFSISTTGGPFCAGQSGTLTASGASSYTWYPFNKTGPGIVVTPSVSGCYTVVGTSPGGCTSSEVNCYSVMPIPSINVSGNTNICSGSSTTLTAIGASTYTWLPGGNSGSSMVVSPTANTCYTVIGSNGFCSSSGLRCVTVQQTTLAVSGPNALCGTSGASLSIASPGSYTWQPGNMTGSSIFVTPTVNTCYTVSGYVGSNCFVSAVKCLSVVANMQLTTSGNQTICAGQLVNISVAGANTYSWSNGSNSSAIFVSPLFNTNYFVTGFIGSCSTSTSVAITVNPLPVVSVVASAPVVCAGSNVQLIANGAGNYTWNWSTGQTGNVAVVTPTANTVYTVTGINAQGCSRSATVSISVFGNCTGVEEVQGTNNVISLYPNPSSGEVKMSSSAGKKVSYIMYDMLGREVLRGEFTGDKTITMNEYTNGSYILRFESGEYVSHQRLIINK